MNTSVKFFVPRLTVGCLDCADCAPWVETPKSRATPSATEKAALTARRVCFRSTVSLLVRTMESRILLRNEPGDHVRLDRGRAASQAVRRDRELERAEREICRKRECRDAQRGSDNA